MKPAFIYCRVSTSGQAIDGVSLDTQSAKAAAWCELNDCEVAGTFVDAGISGYKSSNRPEFQRALDAACAAIGNFNLFWRMLGTARFLPGFIKSPLYFLIARNRYRIFGRFRTCMMPSDEIKSHFLKGGYGVG